MDPGSDTIVMVKAVSAKHDTIILLVKGISFVGIGFLTPLTTALTQYQAQEKMPGPIVWIVVLALCCIGAFSGILSFLSGSYSDYQKKFAPHPPAPFPVGNSPMPTQQTIRT